MRREVGAGAQPVALEDRGDHPRGRGLAVGAEHVDRRRSAARASPARSSSAASGRARSASRTARASAAGARPGLSRLLGLVHGARAPGAGPAARQARRRFSAGSALARASSASSRPMPLRSSLPSEPAQLHALLRARGLPGALATRARAASDAPRSFSERARPAPADRPPPPAAAQPTAAASTRSRSAFEVPSWRTQSRW